MPTSQTDTGSANGSLATGRVSAQPSAGHSAIAPAILVGTAQFPALLEASIEQRKNSGNSGTSANAGREGATGMLPQSLSQMMAPALPDADVAPMSNNADGTLALDAGLAAGRDVAPASLSDLAVWGNEGPRDRILLPPSGKMVPSVSSFAISARLPIETVTEVQVQSTSTPPYVAPSETETETETGTETKTEAIGSSELPSLRRSAPDREMGEPVQTAPAMSQAGPKAALISAPAETVRDEMPEASEGNVDEKSTGPALAAPTNSVPNQTRVETAHAEQDAVAMQPATKDRPQPAVPPKQRPDVRVPEVNLDAPLGSATSRPDIAEASLTAQPSPSATDRHTTETPLSPSPRILDPKEMGTDNTSPLKDAEVSTRAQVPLATPPQMPGPSSSPEITRLDPGNLPSVKSVETALREEKGPTPRGFTQDLPDIVERTNRSPLTPVDLDAAQLDEIPPDKPLPQTATPNSAQTRPDPDPLVQVERTVSPTRPINNADLAQRRSAAPPATTDSLISVQTEPSLQVGQAAEKAASPTPEAQPTPIVPAVSVARPVPQPDTARAGLSAERQRSAIGRERVAFQNQDLSPEKQARFVFARSDEAAKPQLERVQFARAEAEPLSSPGASSHTGAPAHSVTQPLPHAQPLNAQMNPAAMAQQPLQTSASASTDQVSSARPAQPIESVIDQLFQAREAGRSARPELTMRHQEFGAINMRLEATGTDIRATLSSRDPAFAPAIQAALADRSVAAAGESSAANANSNSSNGQSNQGRSQEQSGSQSQNGAGFAGSGGSSERGYGSSTGSGQASSQPYSEQMGPSEDDTPVQDTTAGADARQGGAQGSGLFA